MRNDGAIERTAISIPSPRPTTPEKADKRFQIEAPKIPGVDSHPTALPVRPAVPSKASTENDSRAETERQAGNVYAGRTTKIDLAQVKRLGAIVAGVLLAVMLGSFAVKTFKRTPRTDVDAPAAQNNDPSPLQDAPLQSTERSPYVTLSNPQVATVSELARAWSSKKFFYRSLTLSKDVPALIVRLPGPASESKSYWAFSLEAPFTQCEFAYTDDLAQLSSDYGFEAGHPMVVNPCSGAIFDPLQLKVLPGNIFVRGAMVRGYDLRPPLGIEIKVSGNQIRATAME